MRLSELGGRLLAALRRGPCQLTFYGFEGAEERVDYGEFADQVEALAQRLHEGGVHPGVVVALLGPTSLELCRSIAALWCLGATVTVLPTPSRLGSLETYVMETLGKLEKSQAALLLGEASMMDVFGPLWGGPVLRWEELSATEWARLDLSPATDGAALIQFSSGTTRDPHPIVLSWQALLANSEAVLSCFPGGADHHSCVSWLPLYHDMGLIGGFLMPLLAPGSLTLMGPEVFAARPVTWLEAISTERATTSSAPNFALAYCADRISAEQMQGLNLSCWSIAMVGAEPVRPATLRRFASKFAAVGFSEQAFSPVYGLAEATLAVSFSPLGQGLRTLGIDPQEMAECGSFRPGGYETPSLGRPLPGVEVAIRQGQDDLPEGALGEVFVRSPALFSGYLGSLTAEPRLHEGWLATGDMGFLHQGELYLYGRRRDILLLDGRNHDPSVIEGAVETLEPLRRCCAFTQEEQDRDVLVLACEVSQGFAGDWEELRATILREGHRASGLTPARVIPVKAGSLPVTSSGKLRRAETARWESAGQLELWRPEPSRVG